MGSPIATNLLRAGHQLRVYDLSPTACARLADAGASVGADPADTVRGCDIVVTLLPTSVEVRQTLVGVTGVNGGNGGNGVNGALAAASPGTVFVDMSTGALAELPARGLAAAIAEAGHIEVPAVDPAERIEITATQAARWTEGEYE